MGIFRRRHSGREPGAEESSSPPLPGLPMFTDGDRAARFCALARQVFAEHGMECVYHDGYLRGVDGRSYGLTNVALAAVHEPEREWKTLVDQHATSIVAAHAMPRQREMEAVRERLYLRLWQHEDLPARPHAAEWLGSSGDGLVGLASIDHPEHVETLTGDHDIELLGGWPGIREAALVNLARLRGEEVVGLGEDSRARVQLSVGGFFNASRVFTMAHLLRTDFLLESPSYGVLFAVPNRHLVAVHALAGPDVADAAATLLRLARGESQVPGAISPHVWFWRDGAVQRVSQAPDGDGTVAVRASGLLAQALRELEG